MGLPSSIVERKMVAVTTVREQGSMMIRYGKIKTISVCTTMSTAFFFAGTIIS